MTDVYVNELLEQVHQLREAIRLTREYLHDGTLPAVEGWDWYDAVKASGGFEGFGPCQCVLDPQQFGRHSNGGLKHCTLPIDHDGPHDLKGA